MRVAVLGVGLVGGSLGLACRERAAAEVVGWDPHAGTLERALERGALDAAGGSLAAAVRDADVVVCAAPVSELPDLVRSALRAVGPQTVVSDVGSTKRGLVEAVAAEPGADRFIGGHPLAGAETAGVENARADLFDGARWYLTPSERAEGLLLDRLHGLISTIGARPQAIDAAEHDRLMARVSHLPHVLANVLVARATEKGERRAEVGRSFRDASRVAGANPSIWGDIFAANGPAVAAEVDAVVELLGEAADLLRAGDAGRLRRWQLEAQRSREELLAAHPAGALHELRLQVDNRPGVLAEVGLALGEAGVNIEDMTLEPAPDRRSGAISVWIAGREGAELAARVVSDLGHTVALGDGAG